MKSSKKEGGLYMTNFALLVAVCGAATLTRALMHLVDLIER